MRNRIDNILLGILWVLAVTLGTSFWFNTQFGFNMFSDAHWQYLAYLQASQSHVRPMFYVSLAAAIFILIFGLYILMRPRRRKIRLGQKPIVADMNKKPVNNTQTDASTIDIVAAEPTPKPATASPVIDSKRPPRLNLPPITNRAPQPHQSQPLGTTMLQPNTSPDANAAEIRKIFEDAGYLIKKNPQIGNTRPSLFAIGTNEVLWIGASNISTTDMRRAINKLSNIFTDTLDNIEININGFVINATDAATSEFQDILMFADVNALRDYMAGHHNPPLPPDDEGNFDAYSAYIGTVIDYIGKM